MIESLVAVLVPLLVTEAEKLLGTKSNSHEWVHGLVDEVFNLIEKAIPGWLKPEEEELKQLVEHAIEKLLS